MSPTLVRAEEVRSPRKRLLLMYFRTRQTGWATMLMIVFTIAIWMLWQQESVTAMWAIPLAVVVPVVPASVIGVSSWSPFGELERTTPASLPRLRLLHLGLLGSIGLGSIALTTVWWKTMGIEANLLLVMTRNTLALVGIALLVGVVLDARLSWLAAVMIGLVAGVAIFNMSWSAQNPNELWTDTRWIWLAHDDSDVWAMAISLFVGSAGVVLGCVQGARDTPGDAAL